MRAASHPPSKARPALPAAVRRGYARYLRLALTLPLTEASTSYRTPAVKVAGKLLSRWRTEAEGALAIRCDLLDREILLQTQPDVFFVTPHYLDYPMVLVRLDRASVAQLEDVVERGWRRVAPARALRERDSAGVAGVREKSARRRRS